MSLFGGVGVNVLTDVITATIGRTHGKPDPRQRSIASRSNKWRPQTSRTALARSAGVAIRESEPAIYGTSERKDVHAQRNGTTSWRPRNRRCPSELNPCI